jgi:hypothetical protein
MMKITFQHKLGNLLLLLTLILSLPQPAAAQSGPITLDGEFDDWVGQSCESDASGDASHNDYDLNTFCYALNPGDDTAYFAATRQPSDNKIGLVLLVDTNNDGDFNDATDRLIGIRYDPKKNDADVSVWRFDGNGNAKAHLYDKEDWGEHDDNGARVEWGISFANLGITSGQDIQIRLIAFKEQDVEKLDQVCKDTNDCGSEVLNGSRDNDPDNNNISWQIGPQSPSPTETPLPTETPIPSGPCLIQLDSTPEIGTGGGNKEIKFNIINNATSSVIVDNITPTWDLSSVLIEEIKMPGKVWKHDGSAGNGPSGRQASGVVLDLDDVTIAAGSSIEFKMKFESDISGTSGTLTLATNDDQTCGVSFGGGGTAVPDFLCTTNGASSPLVMDSDFADWVGRVNLDDPNENISGDMNIRRFFYGMDASDASSTNAFFMVERFATTNPDNVRYVLLIDTDNNGNFDDAVDRVLEADYHPENNGSKVKAWVYDLNDKTGATRTELYKNLDWGESINEGGHCVEWRVSLSDDLGVLPGNALRVKLLSLEHGVKIEKLCQNISNCNVVTKILENVSDRAPDGGGDIQWTPANALGWSLLTVVMVGGVGLLWYQRRKMV